MHNKINNAAGSTRSLEGMQNKAANNGACRQGAQHVFANTLAMQRSQTMPENMQAKRSVVSPSASNAIFRSALSMPNNPTTAHQPRRCASDTDVYQARITGAGCHDGALKNYERKATIMMSQRSNAHGVKELVSTLHQKCEAAWQTPPTDDQVPFPECAMLALIANDAYYRAVIGSVNGVATLVKAMKTFPQHVNLQEACCTSLGNLCERNGSNELAVLNANGIEQIIAAMRMHSSSIAVQSAACGALRAMSALILAPQSQLSPQTLSDIVDTLMKARAMYITPRSRECAEQLLMALQRRVPSNC